MSVQSVQNHAVAQSPIVDHQTGRIIVTVMNVAAAAGPIFGAFSNASNATWLEVLADSSVHVVTIATLWMDTPTWAAKVINYYRVATLVFNLSTFPSPAPLLDFFAHTTNCATLDDFKVKPR